jgi:hypothetical protein
MKKLYIALTLTVVTLAASIPVRAYVIAMSRAGTGEIVQHKWKSPAAFPIRWQMNPAQGANVTGSRTQAQVFEAGFASWQAVSSASVSFVRGSDTDAGTRQGADNINLITTNSNAGNALPAGVLALTYGSVYDGPGFDPALQRTIDFAGQIAEADIVFSSTVPFSTSTTADPDRIDLQSVMTHEVGHLLGLDHSPIVSASMFWSVGEGFIYPRNVSTDDMAAISLLYPAGSPAAKGKISGFVRSAGTGSPVYGAVVVAVNANGNPVASAVTDPNGAYTIEGLDAGSYTVFAEPLDGPITISNISSLLEVYPSSTVNSNFTTRFR